MRHKITGSLIENGNEFNLSLFDGKFIRVFNNETEAIKVAHDEMAKFFEINESPIAFIYERKSGQKSVIQYDVEPDGEEWYECSITDYWSLHPFYENNFDPKTDVDHIDRSFYFIDKNIGLEIVAEDIIKTDKIMSETSKEKIKSIADHCTSEYNKAINIYK